MKMEEEMNRSRKEKEKRQLQVRKENFTKLKKDTVEEVRRLKDQFRDNVACQRTDFYLMAQDRRAEI